MFLVRFIVMLSIISFFIASFTASDFAYKLTAFIFFIIFSAYLILDYIFEYYHKKRLWQTC